MDNSISTTILNSILNNPLIKIGGDWDKYLQYIPLFLGGVILALILTPLIGYIAEKYDITYKPGTQRKNKEFDNAEKALHEGITPALGGLAVTLPVLAAMLLLFKLDSFTIPIILATIVLIVGSALDDILNLPAKIQLGYQIIAALIIVSSVINLDNLSIIDINLNIATLNFSIFGLAQSLVFPGDLILFIWILVCINAVKWTAGSPGIIEANSFTIFSLIFIIAVRYASNFSASISAVASGALLMFLVFAFPPQKIMSGSSGKTLYGFLICVLALVADAKISTTLMLLLVPIIDFAYVILKRVLIYKPKNFVELLRINDTSHLHHQLMKMNLTRKQIVLVEMFVTLLIGSLAILSTGALIYFALIFGTALAIGFIVFANIRASQKREQKQKEESPESKYSY